MVTAVAVTAVMAQRLQLVELLTLVAVAVAGHGQMGYRQTAVLVLLL